MKARSETRCFSRHKTTSSSFFPPTKGVRRPSADVLGDLLLDRPDLIEAEEPPLRRPPSPGVNKEFGEARAPSVGTWDSFESPVRREVVDSSDEASESSSSLDELNADNSPLAVESDLFFFGNAGRVLPGSSSLSRR